MPMPHHPSFSVRLYSRVVEVLLASNYHAINRLQLVYQSSFCYYNGSITSFYYSFSLLA